MQLDPATPSGDSRIRCVFDDAVMSFALGDHPTLGEIADMLSAPAMRRYGAPLAIDIAWPKAMATPVKLPSRPSL